MPIAGQWLRFRTGVVRLSHTRWGPVNRLAATSGVAETWRVELSAGIVGNYARGHWFSRGMVSIVQWTDRDREPVWEFALARNEKVTFVGVRPLFLRIGVTIHGEDPSWERALDRRARPALQPPRI